MEMYGTSTWREGLAPNASLGLLPGSADGGGRALSSSHANGPRWNRT